VEQRDWGEDADVVGAHGVDPWHLGGPQGLEPLHYLCGRWDVGVVAHGVGRVARCGHAARLNGKRLYKVIDRV
jgi:hypothetical protein